MALYHVSAFLPSLPESAWDPRMTRRLQQMEIRTLPDGSEISSPGEDGRFPYIVNLYRQNLLPHKEEGAAIGI